MTSGNEEQRRQLVERLLSKRSALPTAPLSRLGRTALTALRVRRKALPRHDGDLDAVASIVESLGQLKGLSMKVGQIMSYIDVALPDDLRDALSVLQTHAPPMPIEQVRSILEAELGQQAKDVLHGLEPTPVAAASIGQVHRATLPNGTPVAVKVQYPEIETAIRSDFKPAVLGTAIASMVYPGARIDAFVEEARARLLEECDYEHEAGAQRRFETIYEGHPVIVVPGVHRAYCSRRMLTSTWIRGSRFDDFLAEAPAQPTRDRMGEALFGFYVGSLFEHGIYNCDPHPGNYLFLDGGRVAVLDFGCTRQFEEEMVSKLARLTLAVHRDDREQLHQSFLDLGMVPKDRQYDFETARGLVRAFYGPMLVDALQPIDLGQAMGMRKVLEGKRELMRLTLPGEFLFLFRIRFGLMSILAKLGARANWFQLEERWAEAALA